MLALSSQQQSNRSPQNPRRLPAHLSVSLRHESAPTSPASEEAKNAEFGGTKGSRRSPRRQDSDESGKSGESNVQVWFDHSNTRPEAGYMHGFDDNDPPYFLPHNSSSTSNNDVPVSRMEVPYHMPGIQQSGTNASSADDFRSVIDDLTIENKKLKERLRRYERFQPAQLEKDKMFELKIHGLPARKRRELEDVLRQFASSVEESSDEGAKLSVKSQHMPYSNLNPQMSNSTTDPKHTPSSSTSNSRPNDSAYASMSTSTSHINSLPEKALGLQSRLGREQNIQSFLHNIPKGLLPRHPPVMTERQKKKLVVQRLEQLFTGKRGAISGENSQPLQQQEVSNSAARADEATRIGPPEEEGAREAHILPMEIDVEGGKPSKLVGISTVATPGSALLTFDSSDEQSPERASPKQRPTRPLDLDPDRAQIPAENVEYIRHLGLSTPQLVTEDSADVTADGEGWIYLNLLINMAQLHIINVTPEFVRSAVSDVSEKFQLSQDGRKIRWRGGSDGTRLSSDSGESSVRNRSPQDSDSGLGGKKKRKVEVGRSVSAPVDEIDSNLPVASSGPSSKFHYKPLFRHHNSSSGGMGSTDDSDSPFGSGPEMDSGSRRISRGAHAWSGVPQSGGAKRRRREDGPIVFYSGAQFYTDLSGDGKQVVTPLHLFGVGKDGYSTQVHNALGSSTQNSTPTFARTTSGSLLPYRPFKDYSKGHNLFQTEETRPKTPELFKDESDEEQFISDIPIDPSPYTQLQDFEVSGLGGIQPTDHFAVAVETRREKMAEIQHRKLSPFLRLSSTGKAPRKFMHKISRECIDSFHETTAEETITNRLASWPGFSSPPRSSAVSSEQPLVKTEIVSAKYIPLEPSPLPPPVGWTAMDESSDEDSDASSSSAGISHLRRDRTFERSRRSFSHRVDASNDPDLADESNEVDEVSETDTDSNIDMLAHVRRVDPFLVAEQERVFAMEVDNGDGKVLRSSAATINDESGYSSAVSAA